MCYNFKSKLSFYWLQKSYKSFSIPTHFSNKFFKTNHRQPKKHSSNKIPKTIRFIWKLEMIRSHTIQHWNNSGVENFQNTIVETDAYNIRPFAENNWKATRQIESVLCHVRRIFRQGKPQIARLLCASSFPDRADFVLNFHRQFRKCDNGKTTIWKI